jgi:phosphatidylserine/phosphatidylglycerophosphate/cardiolipin synthase-like enzyme
MSRLYVCRIAALFLASLCLAPAIARAAKPSFEDAFSPHQGATALIVSALEEADRTVYVAAYSFTSKRIAAALMKAHDRGVDVEIVIDASERDGKQARLMSEYGIPLRLNDRYNIMHDKFMVIDGHTLELGSFNYTLAAESQNAENVLVIRNCPDIARDYAQQWRKLWDEARPFGSLPPLPLRVRPGEKDEGAPPNN